MHIIDLTWFFRFSIESIVRISGITVYMLVRSPFLGGCALCIIPVVAVVNKKYGDWLRENAIAVQTALAQANSAAQEALSCVRTVISFAAEDHELQKYSDKIDIQYKLNIRQVSVCVLTHVLSDDQKCVERIGEAIQYIYGFVSSVLTLVNRLKSSS